MECGGQRLRPKGKLGRSGNPDRAAAPEPGRVFDRVTTIEGVPDGYRAMNEREAIKVMIEF